MIKKPNTRTRFKTITSVQQGIFLKTRSYTVRFALYSSISVTSSWLRISCALKKLTNKKQKIFSEKQKGFRDGLSYSTPQKSKETRGNAITQPRSHPIPKFYIFLMGLAPTMPTSTTSPELASTTPTSDEKCTIVDCYTVHRVVPSDEP